MTFTALTNTLTHTFDHSSLFIHLSLYLFFHCRTLAHSFFSSLVLNILLLWRKAILNSSFPRPSISCFQPSVSFSPVCIVCQTLSLSFVSLSANTDYSLKRLSLWQISNNTGNNDTIITYTKTHKHDTSSLSLFFPSLLPNRSIVIGFDLIWSVHFNSFFCLAHSFNCFSLSRPTACDHPG